MRSWYLTFAIIALLLGIGDFLSNKNHNSIHFLKQKARGPNVLHFPCDTPDPGLLSF